MVVLTDITVPADEFVLGRLLEEFPDIDIEIQRIVSLQEGVMPYVWVGNAPIDEVEAAIRDDSVTESVSVISETDRRTLFEIRWSPEINGLIQSLVENDASVLVAQGTADEWEFRLQFADRDDLTGFRDQCEANDVTFEVRRVYNPAQPDEHSPLTDPQLELLTAAFELGYWEVPRDHTLGEIADHVGISTNAASQRLRRGVRTVVENGVIRSR